MLQTETWSDWMRCEPGILTEAQIVRPHDRNSPYSCAIRAFENVSRQPGAYLGNGRIRNDCAVSAGLAIEIRAKPGYELK
jgi:hypothetical protein